MLVKIGVMNESSWEEEAFAEDGRGPLGGFVWPPTSYSCNFCSRQFRSAQALGGHMNIHRRERARLKQSLNSTTINPPQNPNSNSPNPSFSSSSSSRVSLSQRTLCSNISADTRNSTSCVSSHHGAHVEINFNLGFRLNSNTINHHHHGGFGHDDDVINCKRQKTTVIPLIVGSIVEEVDLELRLAT